MWGQTDLRSVVRGGIDPAHQLPRNASSMSGLSILPTGHTVTPCASTLRQQVRGVVHKSPGWLRLEATLHAGKRSSCVGQEQSVLAEGEACAGQNEPRSRHVVEEQCLFGGMDVSPAHGSENLGNLWQGSSRPLRLQRQLSLPNIFDDHEWSSLPLYAFPPNRSATAGTQTSQGTTAQASLNSPDLEEPTVGVRIIPAAHGSPVANPPQTGPPFSSWRHDMASTAQVMGPACVAARWEPFSLPERVLSTMAEARAPSTRCLYALKWSIFSACVKTET